MADRALDACEGVLESVAEPDRTCLLARLLDQRAFRLTAMERTAQTLAQAEAVLQGIPLKGVPFVIFRRNHSLAWVHWRQGRADAAALAERARRPWRQGRALSAAGDGGLLRLRAAALALLACIEPDRRDELQLRRQAILASLH